MYMDVLVSSLRKSGFSCLNRDFATPIVINCVPGSGKSTIIRELISSDSRFEAITFGAPDPVNLSGRYIRSGSAGFSSSCTYRIVDEYTEGDWRSFSPFAIFGDPIQSLSGEGTLKADFCCFKTQRFGKETCKLLNRFGFEIESDIIDEVIIGGLYEVEPKGVVIAADGEVYELAATHGLEVFCIEEVRGKTFEETTVLVSEESIPEDKRANYFVALTRHIRKVTVLSPDASFGSSQLL